MRFRSSLPARRNTPLHVERLDDRIVPTVYTVNALTDTGTGSGAAGDLRYCVNQADADSSIGADSIQFAVDGTVVLSGGQLELTRPETPAIGPGLPNATIDYVQPGLTIDGNGHSVAIDAHGASRVFQADAEAWASLTGLTIEDGVATTGTFTDDSGKGGDVLNAGTLSVSHSTVTGGLAFGGGGIASVGPGR